ncbi:YhdP family protein [Alteromonas gilva]|uniref:YhdP family protein n=1 Tax=Alteromonas gilva TaxID=2987522 RepID=A0ABT5KY92_9ALTE|nr:YhdP family protein [Alteromonas gilva]MDC8829744.1 YhdP family protein [Alteromonas gilva]
MNRPLIIATYIVKKLWLIFAIVLVMFAVLVSALRYTLPYLDEEKQLLEDYLSDQYGIQLTIDSLSAAWQGTGPSIVLNGVKFLQGDLSPVELRLEQVYVEVDFWQSIQQRELSSKRFDLVGLHAQIDTQRIEKSGEGEFPIVEALRSLFLDQLQSFSLRNGEVTLVTPEEEQVIELSQLFWVNKDERHQGRGEIRVQDLTNNSASFVLDLYGKKTDLSGTLYAKGEALDISPWVSAWLPTNSPVKHSRGNFEFWAQLDSSEVSAIQIEFADSDIAWQLPEEDHILETQIRGGSIQALPTASGWSLRVDQLTLQADNNTLITDLVGQLDHNGNVIVNTVKPLTLSPILAMTPIFTGGDKLLKTLSPSAELATLQLQWQQKQLSVAAKVFDMQWQQSGHLPGVNSLDGDFYWYQNQGVLELDGSGVELAIDGLLPNDLTLDAMHGKAYIYATAPGDWVLEVDDLQLSSALVNLSQSMRYEFGSDLFIAALNVGSMPLSKVPELFPEDYMGSNTVSYLRRAFSGDGQVERASILWYGNPGQFPFADGQGIFQAAVEVSDAEFTFAREWPALSELDMRLLFENEALIMTSEASTLHGIALSDLRAVIPRLAGSSVLTIDAKGAGTGKQLASLMLQSSLQNSLGKVLSEDVKVSGPLTSDIKLEIPLNGSNVQASGVAALPGNTVNISSLDLTFADVTGEVAFTNAAITIDALSASLFEQPVTVNLSGVQQDSDYLLDMAVDANWRVQPLIAQLLPSYGKYLAGAASWQSDISVTLGADGFEYTASMTSDLLGVASTLPAPFTKSSEQPRELEVRVKGNTDTSGINLNIGSEVQFTGVLPHAEKQFSRAHLALGNSGVVGLGTGFNISAALEQVDLSQWYQAIALLVNDLPTTTVQDSRKSPPVFTVPQRIFVETANLVIAGQTLTDVTLSARQQNSNWLLNVVSSQATAQVKLFEDWLERGIDVDADFIRLTQWHTDDDQQGPVGEQLQPDSLPPIRFQCGSCVILDKDFGAVDLEVTRAQHGLQLTRLAATNNFGELRATGTWLKTDEAGSRTHFEGDINSDNIGGMLAGLGVNSGIKDSHADIEFNLDWNSSPFNFTFDSLNGSVSTELTDGYLTQVSDKGSRIFTLFSLNSLIRKLSLDFRDVFAQGFFYDDIKGSLDIVDGVASTSDTVVDGGAGEIVINGYTNLEQQTLNYNVSFTPNVTGNLPFLVYFMANPPTALAALALDQVLTSAKVISNVNYRITGTLDDPQLEEVGRDSTEIELPAQQRETQPEVIDGVPVQPDNPEEPDNADS